MINESTSVTLFYVIIINSTTDQSCDHAVLKSSIHAGKSERSKNSHLNLLYTHCNLLTVCSNYLASMMSTSLDCKSLNSREFLNSCELCCAAAADKRRSVKDFFRFSYKKV